MNRNLLALLLCFFTFASGAQNTITGTLQNTDQTFTRPNEGAPPTTYSPYGNVRYDVYPVNVSTAGLIMVTVTSTFDNFVILYDQNGFLPSIPLTNALVANDDFSGQDAGFAYNITTPGIYYLVVSSFKNSVSGPYTVNLSSSVVLPVKLTSFTATKSTDNRNLIKWTTSEEVNVSHYQVQKSANNILFEDVAKGAIAATNNPLGASYQFFDVSVATANQFYRLKITDKSGVVSYSPIAVIKQSTAAIVVSAFPNPTVDFLQVEMKGMQGKRASVTVVSASGAIVVAGQYRFNNLSYLNLNVAALQPGSYFLKLNSDVNKVVLPFIKK